MTQFVKAYHGKLIRPYDSLEAAVADISPRAIEPESYTFVQIENRRKVAYFDHLGNPVVRKASFYSKIPTTWNWWDGVSNQTAAVS